MFPHPPYSTSERKNDRGRCDDVRPTLPVPPGVKPPQLKDDPFSPYADILRDEARRATPRAPLLLDITNPTALRPDGHMSRHWSGQKGYACR